MSWYDNEVRIALGYADAIFAYLTRYGAERTVPSHLTPPQNELRDLVLGLLQARGIDAQADPASPGIILLRTSPDDARFSRSLPAVPERVERRTVSLGVDASRARIRARVAPPREAPVVPFDIEVAEEAVVARSRMASVAQREPWRERVRAAVGVRPIRFDDPIDADASAVDRAIARELWHGYSPLLRRMGWTVSVVDRRVTLYGRVREAAATEALVNAILRTGGLREVVDATWHAPRGLGCAVSE